MGLEEVVTLTILSGSSPPSRQSFGTMLIMAYHNVTANLLETYKSLTEMTDAGFLVTSPAYRAVQAAFSQNPRPAQVVIGKRTNAYTQILHLTPIKTTEGFHYKFEVVDPAGVVTAIDYTVLAGATVNSICVALAALLAPIADSTAVVDPAAPNATHIIFTTTAGKLTNMRKLPLPAHMAISDESADPGIAAELSAIETEDDTSWYGIGFDHSPRTVIEAVATWTEARRKLAMCNTSDSECLNPSVTDDVASTLQDAAYMRTDLLFSGTELLSYSAIAWMGVMLPKDPGSATWAFKTLKGITADKLTSGQKTAATAKRLNTYTTIAGVNVTQWGQGPDSGYTDIVVGTDWIYATIQTDVFAAIAAADKIGYTDSDTDIFRNVINSDLRLGQKRNFIARDPEFTITIPKVADQSLSDRQNRHFPDIEWTATYTGAIHTVDISGLFSF